MSRNAVGQVGGGPTKGTWRSPRGFLETGLWSMRAGHMYTGTHVDKAGRTVEAWK